MAHNPHAHLENPELAKEKEELDNKYDSIKVTSEDLDQAKSESLFSSKNWKSPEDRKLLKNQILAAENEEEKDLDSKRSFDTKEWQSEAFKKNSKYTTVIWRLFETESISKDTKEILLSEDFDNIDIDKVKWSIPINEKNIVKQSFNKIKESNKPANLEIFKKDIKEIKNHSAFNSFDLEIKDWKYESEVLNMLWSNYIEFPSHTDTKDIKKDISTAIVLTKSEIEKTYTNLSRDSESYKVAIDNINSGDIEKQMQWISSLYILGASKAWELGKTTIDKYKKSKIEKLISEFQKLNKEFDELEAKKTTEKINERKKEINERITEIWDEANEIEGWEIFESDDKEKIQSNIENISENN